MRSFRSAVAVAFTALIVGLGGFAPSSAGAADSSDASTSTASAAAPAPAVGSNPSGASVRAIGDCVSTNFCFWVNANYSGARGQLSGSNTDWRVFGQSSCQTGNWSDCASSGYNRGTSGLGVQVWRDINYSGLNACLPQYWYNSNFANLVWPGSSTSFNDSISSNYWTSNC